MKIGQHLATKDGLRNGNAILVAIEQSEHGLGTLYIIETDFGNTAKLTATEIEELFYTRALHNDEERITPVAEWRADRHIKQLEAEAYYPHA